ncbi:MAG: SOS response-associated peptidase [Hyphomicrobiales bacterium]|nr:SOS response-associated peptidase [Hyphomicrobiales bacterium]
MCGRYAITLPPEAMRKLFGFVEQPNFPPRYNVAPTQPVPIVRANDGQRRFGLVRWGFLPGFVKDPKAFPLIINARAEGITAKPSFRAAMRRRRCLFIADGWYEWRRLAGAGLKVVKQPFLLRRRDRAPMGFAGLYETWSDPQGGEIETGCIVTTSANAATVAVHDRMPVILDPKDFDRWLDCSSDKADPALDLMRPAPDDLIEFFEVSSAVNSYKSDGPQLQAPTGRANLI